ncbi:hypothetical protein JCM17823_06910 [Halorubrum gandharaense]
MAIITAQLIDDTVRPITWVQWAVYMIPPMLLLFALSTVSVMYLYRLDGDRTIDASRLDDSMTAAVESENGTLNRNQSIVGAVMLGAVVAWIVGSFLGIPTIVPAAVAVAILAVPGVDIVDRELISEVSWGILFLIGAMFSILEVMEATGTLDLLIGVLINTIPFEAMAPWLIVSTLLAIAVSIRLWFSTASAAIVITLPIIMEFGVVLGIDGMFLALSVLIIVGSTTFFPFNTTSVLLSYDRGPLTLREVLGFGLVTMVHGAVVIAFSWLFYWPLVV